MRVLQLTYEFPDAPGSPIVSGEVKNPFYLIQGLKHAGHDLEVFSVPVISKRQPSSRQCGDIRVQDVPDGRFRAIVKYATRHKGLIDPLDTAIKNSKPDIIHAHSPSLTRAATEAVRRNRLRTPIITTAHGTYIPELYADHPTFTLESAPLKGNAWLCCGLDRQSFRHSDYVISVSDFQVKELLNLYRLPESKIAVILNGIDLDVYQRPDPNVLPSSHPTILFVGRLVKKKGLHILAKAAKSIVDAVPDVRFRIVGGSEGFAQHKPFVMQALESSGVRDRFELTMDVPEGELARLYRTSAAVVVPSVNYESIPTVIMEAMACGVPVVATDAWGVREVVGAPSTLVPEANVDALAKRLIDILKRPDFARDLVRDNDRMRERISLTRMVREHEFLYERALRECGS